MMLRHSLSALLLPLLLGGCAATSVMNPYPGQAAGWQRALDAGQPDSAIAVLEKKNGADRLLYRQEQGRVAQLADKPETSRTAFDDAIAAYQQREARAVISASASLASGASLLTNDNAIPYEGSLYERVFVHQYQALNFLAAGDATGALVEVRRANQIQNQALAQKENTVDKAREDAERKGLDTERYANYFSSMDLAAGRVKTGFQNAATFYLSALIYEAVGEHNSAYIDYRKALELVPDNPYVQRDVVRTGLRSGMDEVQKLAQSLGGRQIAPKPGEGELVIYLEEGYVPAKTAISIPIWTSKTINQLSFPVYDGNVSAPSPMVVTVNGQTLETALLVDTRALAVRTLKDEIPGMLARAFLRLLAKQEMQRQLLQNDSTGLMGLAAGLYSLVTDAADLRSWLTLPGSGQVLRLPLPAGSHTVSLPGLAPLPVEVRNGRPTLVHLAVLPGKTYSRVYPL
ncbi:MAG: COG3014 family protein [Moraxellaceae bacterium]